MHTSTTTDSPSGPLTAQWKEHTEARLAYSGVGSAPADQARAVAELLDELGLESVHVAGNSIGGWVALELARLRRARSVTALSPGGLWGRKAPLFIRATHPRDDAAGEDELPSR